VWYNSGGGEGMMKMEERVAAFTAVAKWTWRVLVKAA